MAPFVTIIIPPHGAGMEPQTLTVDINGPERVFIIGEGKVALGFTEGDAPQGFGNTGMPNGAIADALKKAQEVINQAGLGAPLGGSAAPSVPDSPSALAGGSVPPMTGTPEDIEFLKSMGFDDEQIKEHFSHQASTDAAPTPEQPKTDPYAPPEPKPDDPVDPSTLETTEERVAYLEGLEDKGDLTNQKYALGLFRNAKDEGRQDLVDRICTWMGLPEMIVETQAPKSA